jgi:hypothetical protein
MLVDPKVAGEVERRFAKPLPFLRGLHEVGRTILRDEGPKENSRGHLERLALLFLSRGVRAVNAVEVLFCVGLDDGAASCLRTLAELTIDFDWIWKADTENRARLFIDYATIISFRTKQMMAQKYGGSSEASMEELIQQTPSNLLPQGVTTAEEFEKWREDQYQRIKDNYPDKNSWCSSIERSIYRRANETNNAQIYDLAYRYGCDAVHSNAGTMTDLFSIRDGVASIATDPGIPKNPMSVGLTSLCFLQLASHAAKRLNLPKQVELLEEWGKKLPEAFQ